MKNINLLGTSIIAISLLALGPANSWAKSGNRLEALAQGEKKGLVVHSQVAHDLEIHDNGGLSLNQRLEMIERAKETIEVEYFIYDRTASSRVFTQALVRAAKRGVKVRILLDYFLVSPEINGFVAELLDREGIEVRYYNKVSILRFIKYQYRNHRKMLVVDNQEAMTGGRNIADEYFDLKDSFNFIDKDVYLKGPLAKDMAKSFDLYWNHKLVKKYSKPKRPKSNEWTTRVVSDDMFDWGSSIDPYDKVAGRQMKAFKSLVTKFEKKEREAQDFLTESEKDRELLNRLVDFSLDHNATVPKASCRELTFVSDAPGWGRKSWKEKYVRDFILEKINSVNKELIIDSPYFITDSDTKKALKSLRKRNADLFINTNSLYSTDAIYVNAVFNSIAGNWIKRGAHVWIFNGDHLGEQNYPVLDETAKKARWGTHTKSFVFDEKAIFIGTYNFDPRSNRQNTEMGLYCEGVQVLVSAMKDNFKIKTDAGAHLKTRKDLRKHKFDRTGFGKIMLYYLMKPFALIFKNLL